MPTTRSAAPAPLFWRTDSGPTVDQTTAARHLAAADPDLARVIERVGPPGLTPPPIRNPYHYLQRAIIHQQLSGAAAETIFGRFLALYDRRAPAPGILMATPPERLREAGLSRSKAAALLDLARHAASGRIPGRAALGRMEPDAIQECLCAVRGVGPWTVEMLLMFYLGHPDILPLGDLGIRKGFGRAFLRTSRLPAAATVARRGLRWRPYRSLASWYLWRLLDLPER